MIGDLFHINDSFSTRIHADTKLFKDKLRDYVEKATKKSLGHGAALKISILKISILQFGVNILRPSHFAFHVRERPPSVRFGRAWKGKVTLTSGK